MRVSRILVVEDEALVAEDIRQQLEEAGYEVIATTDSGESALQILEDNPADLIMMDIMLAGELDGIETAQQIKRCYATPVVFLSAYSDQAKLERARLAEPYGYLIKPFDERELKSTLTMALYKSEADRQIREGKRWTETVLSSLEGGVVTVDTDGSIVYMNRHASEFFSSSLKEMQGKPVDDLFKPHNEHEIPLSMHVSRLVGIDQSEVLEDELQIDLGGGLSRILDIRLNQLKVINHTVDGVVIVFTDITHLKGIEAELRHMNSELADLLSARTSVLSEMNRELELEKDEVESLSSLKSNYLTRMSSNLDAVYNSVMRMTDAMLESGNLSAEQRSQVEEIAASIRSKVSEAERFQVFTDTDQ